MNTASGIDIGIDIENILSSSDTVLSGVSLARVVKLKEGICVVTTNQEYDACLVYFAQKRNLYSLHFKFVVLVVHAYYSLFLFLIFLCVLKSLLSRFLFLFGM